MTDTGSQRASDAASCTKEPLAVRVGAELAGSFIVFFAIYSFTTFGTALFGINMAFIALATGIAYAAVTLVFSKVSGGQLNPAITLAAILTGKTKVLDGILYIIAQVLGGIPHREDLADRCRQRLRQRLRLRIHAEQRERLL